MCFFTQLSETAQRLEHRFQAQLISHDHYKTGQFIAHTFPMTPVITNDERGLIQFYYWGLMPVWAKDADIRKYTLNARSETINEKPSFKGAVKNRCLVLVDGFFEWQWLDEKGKKKQKYLIKLKDNQAFALGAIYSRWLDKNEIIKKTEVAVEKRFQKFYNSYSILTIEADDFMAKIHNSKKRMPIILTDQNWDAWLNGNSSQPSVADLVAEPL